MWGYDIHYSVQATAELLHEGEKREKGELARINYFLLFLKFFFRFTFFLVFFFLLCVSFPHLSVYNLSFSLFVNC